MTFAGRYELKELLGRGGMGEVWLGRDSSLLRRDVAVKVLPPLMGSGAVRRFQREASTLAMPQHPGITVVHDAGEHDGCLFGHDHEITQLAQVDIHCISRRSDCADALRPG
ncbi:hypothetical protein CG723_17535 [Streptomyces sp. CB01635]|uniref:hypothetical protein n=1 Tax=Streptomyces sp. CB01635 TaxID=2020326 RepID=UPI000C2768C1|nr:hypothetical protein CG723_17535 [Streptomyces sp. CB01635]